MHYINIFFVYSIIGYIFETHIMKSKSGILYGPITPIYGVGATIINILSKYLFYNLHLPRWQETIITALILVIILTILELISGILIEKIFHIVFWDYSYLKFHIGHYIALEVSLGWMVASLILIYFINPILDEFIIKIPIEITYSLIFIFIIDIILTIKKAINNC